MSSTLTTRINTRYTTSSQYRAIRQAMRLIDEGGAIRTFKDNGWFGPSRGAFKTAFAKHNIVVKRGPENQLKHELKLWRKTRSGKHRKYRKNLARVFGIYKGWIIQKKVPKGRRERAYLCRDYGCYKIAKKLSINDWWCHNHYHTDKYPIWFDTTAY